MGCPAVTTSCCVLAWPLKLYLSRCHPRRSATDKMADQEGSATECSSTGSSQKRPCKNAVFYASFFDNAPAESSSSRRAFGCACTRRVRRGAQRRQLDPSGNLRPSPTLSPGLLAIADE